MTYLHIWPTSSDLPLYLTSKLQPIFIFDLPAQTYFYIWTARSSLPSYLTCQLWPTKIFDLPALTYLYTWPASSDLPLYLTCQLWPTFILDLQAEVCTCPACWSPWPDRTPLLSVWWRWTRGQSTWTWTLRPCATHRHPPVWCRLAPSGDCQCRLLTAPGRWRSLPLALGTRKRQSGENTGSAWKVTSPTSSSPRGEPAFQTLNEIYNSKQVKREGYIRFTRRPVENITDSFISWRGTSVPDMVAKCISLYTDTHMLTQVHT